MAAATVLARRSEEALRRVPVMHGFRRPARAPARMEDSVRIRVTKNGPGSVSLTQMNRRAGVRKHRDHAMGAERCEDGRF